MLLTLCNLLCIFMAWMMMSRFLQTFWSCWVQFENFPRFISSTDSMFSTGKSYFLTTGIFFAITIICIRLLTVCLVSIISKQKETKGLHNWGYVRSAWNLLRGSSRIYTRPPYTFAYFSVRLYADDTSLTASWNDLDKLLSEINNHLNDIFWLALL